MNLSGIVFFPQIAAYISAALMQLYHLNCLAGGKEKKKSTKQNFVYQENKAYKIACDTHQHKDSYTSPARGQNKSRQFGVMAQCLHHAIRFTFILEHVKWLVFKDLPRKALWSSNC